MKHLLLALTLSLSAVVAHAQAGALVVAADGSGQFRTVQAAIDAAPSQSARPVVIRLKPGIYHEKVVVPALKTHLVLRGDDAASTVITYADHVGANGISTPTSYSVLVRANDFAAENVTFENAAGYTAGQAVALHVEADRAAFRHCRLVGNQDVLFLALGAPGSTSATATSRVPPILFSGPARRFLTTALSRARKTPLSRPLPRRPGRRMALYFWGAS